MITKLLKIFCLGNVFFNLPLQVDNVGFFPLYLRDTISPNLNESKISN